MATITKEDQDKKNQERFEVMAVRLARHLKLSSSDTYEALPKAVKITFSRLKYYEIVMPLIENDRVVSGLTYRQLEIKYGLAKSTIGYHLNTIRKK